MEPLLAWALRMTEDISPDIAAAWREYRQLDDGTHPSQAALAGLTPRQRLEEYLRQARRSGQPLPGHDTGSGLTVNYSHLARILGFSKRSGYHPWRPAWKKLVCDAGCQSRPAPTSARSPAASAASHGAASRSPSPNWHRWPGCWAPPRSA